MAIKLKKMGGKNEVKSKFTKEELEKMAEQYASISVHAKELEKAKKALAEKIKEGASILGVEDDKGSHYIDGFGFVYGRTASSTFKINDERAIPVLKTLKLYDSCVKTVEVVDVNAVQKAVDEGKIELDAVQDFTDVKVTYKVMVKQKEEMPEIELKSVAKRKGK